MTPYMILFSLNLWYPKILQIPTKILNSTCFSEIGRLVLEVPEIIIGDNLHSAKKSFIIVLFAVYLYYYIAIL